MHHLLFTNSRCLTNTLMRFGTRWRHLQGVLCQLLNFQNVRNNVPNMYCRNAVYTYYMQFLKLRDGGLDGS